jgi:nucleotide-binding universal stress UspA family protein
MSTPPPQPGGPSSPLTTVNRIVVGVDGSPGSQAALEFAVAEAGLRGSSVQALHSWQCPVSDGGWVVPMIEYERYARGVLDDAVAKATARKDPPPALPPVDADLQEGHPAERLLAASKAAELLVVGSRGHGGFVGLLLGSVSQHVVTHASCPVVVVQEPGEQRGGTSA